MAIFDDPRKKLEELQQQLCQVEDPEESGEPETPPMPLSENQVYYEEDYRAQRRAPKLDKNPEKKRPKKGCGCVLLAIVEFAVLMALIGRWLQWISASR